MDGHSLKNAIGLTFSEHFYFEKEEDLIDPCNY